MEQIRQARGMGGIRAAPLVVCLLLFFLHPETQAWSTLFNFSSFPPNIPDIIFSGDAYASGEKEIQLTRNQRDKDLLQSAGRATYSYPIQIWDPSTGAVADFCSQFKFVINGLDAELYGDGLAFFLAPSPSGSQLPENSTGEWLGLFNRTTDNDSRTQLIAVEFDTFQNSWDPSANHIGIDINSIVSVTTKNWKTQMMRSGATGSAWVGYNSSTRSFYVFLSYNGVSFKGEPSLSYTVDLKTVLPQHVVVGFSASTGTSTELHKILSWSLTSSMGLANDTQSRPNSSSSKWVVWLIIPLAVLSVVAFALAFSFWRRRKRVKRDGVDPGFDISMDEQFRNGTGPKRFTYKQLAWATKNFSDEEKLGQGGFGGVYKAAVSHSKDVTEIMAVKKISQGSSQGRKEYITEVSVISRLRHRNLVRLIGWCHDNGEFLLVYEYLPNGSLDYHLFGKKSSLTWSQRYSIALGLAAALLYLHEEWELCVVHRDVKSSNVMLDSNFNAKLGDFGLARFVDHGTGSQTTVLAGTMGYLAPECVTTGKASKESDVYSFGVVALEIACGRKALEPAAAAPEVSLVEWVWGLYGAGRLIDAVDETLEADFDERQMERLMVTGLWCAHPDHELRPTIRKAIQVLNLEAPLPTLPAKLPVPVYYAPPLAMAHFSCGSSGTVGSDVSCGSSRSSPGSSSASCSVSSVASSTQSLLDKPKRGVSTPGESIAR